MMYAWRSPNKHTREGNRRRRTKILSHPSSLSLLCNLTGEPKGMGESLCCPGEHGKSRICFIHSFIHSSGGVECRGKERCTGTSSRLVCRVLHCSAFRHGGLISPTLKPPAQRSKAAAKESREDRQTNQQQASRTRQTHPRISQGGGDPNEQHGVGTNRQTLSLSATVRGCGREGVWEADEGKKWSQRGEREGCTTHYCLRALWQALDPWSATGQPGLGPRPRPPVRTRASHRVR